MRVLLDACVPARLRHELAHVGTIESARFAGLSKLSNGALLAAISGRYDALVTADKSMRFEQNMDGRSFAVVVIVSVDNDLAQLQPIMPAVAAALATIRPGDVIEV